MRAVLIFGVWTVIGLVFSAQWYFAAFRSDQPVPWSRALYVQMSWGYLWALATPLVLWLIHRFPVDKQNWRRNVPTHLLTSTLLTFIVGITGHTFLYFVYGRPAGRPYLFQNSLRHAIGNYTEGIGIYLLIAFLFSAYGYYQRYRQGMLRASQLEAQLSQAQLQALKMQLHPHFLFNTLHSISALLYKDTEAARKMITRLGDFLRLTLENSGTQEVTLKQEMEFLRCYLEIERIRFQDRLTTRLFVDPNALDTLVPNLILQPIVENAIRYAIAPRSTPGEIEILAQQEDGFLRIRIRDDGPGLPMNRSVDSLFKKGLGLVNTQARLDHMYGAEHRFEIANDPDGGLAVTLEIPSMRENGWVHHNGQRPA
ncbi:MAG: two-component system, LytTR family, sensor kinase [Acidobacteriota bacterium]|nr:two-component system, LytTR family, sensor kinase [Acidobacteriota bacterium]